MVTGRPEDVADAKREIECAAEHFTQIRASRRPRQGGAPAPGHSTAYVRYVLLFFHQYIYLKEFSIRFQFDFLAPSVIVY